MLLEIEHPTVGKFKTVGFPVKYSRTPSSIRHPPPLLGQHTIEILKDLVDYSNDEINELVAEGIIQ
jgi:crotonobetainyl-CoA:carnitine CoA-transferase CaiB-like acyl-CoA transferase